MKKIVSITLILILTLAFAACGKKTEESFDAQKAAETLLASEYFKGAALTDVKDAEVEFNIEKLITEDTEQFFFARISSGVSANMFIIAKAKDGSASFMYEDMEIIVEQYSSEWVDSTYPEKLAQADKVKGRYVSKENGVFICIISEDNEACLKLIEE